MATKYLYVTSKKTAQSGPLKSKDGYKGLVLGKLKLNTNTVLKMDGVLFILRHSNGSKLYLQFRIKFSPRMSIILTDGHEFSSYCNHNYINCLNIRGNPNSHWSMVKHTCFTFVKAQWCTVCITYREVPLCFPNVLQVF